MGAADILCTNIGATRQLLRVEKNMEKNRFSQLMHYVCVVHGYCGTNIHGVPSYVTHYIPDFGFVAAEDFSEWVMLAEDIGPEKACHFRERHKRDFEAAFVRYMGADMVPADWLRWDYEG